MRPSTCFWISLTLAASTGASTGSATTPSANSGSADRSILKETVKVRLTTLDVAVFDREDRTVPGLHAEDFDLLVDGRRVPIDTFDPTCAGALEMPKSGWVGNWSEPNA